MDEAERCHRLAILDRGRIAAEGEPKQLARDIDATVIEIGDADFVSARRALAKLPDVRSIAQLGNQLRVLMPRGAADPVRQLEVALAPENAAASVQRVGASLEDVFVAATRLRDGAGKPSECAA
jgi:ABC-2 type transport system ATP-binding protein